MQVVYLQFEDFQSKWAFKLLQRYRKEYRMFNDDVQVCNSSADDICFDIWKNDLYYLHNI